MLFGADAHPDDLARALRRYDPGDGKIHFDAVKVVHLGSAGNNTSELIGLLESSLWLVSTNGSRHRHPDPEAIARIVLSKPAGKKLQFNYATKYNKVWENADLQARFDYTVGYGPDAQPTVIDLSS